MNAAEFLDAPDKQSAEDFLDDKPARRSAEDFLDAPDSKPVEQQLAESEPQRAPWERMPWEQRAPRISLTPGMGDDNAPAPDNTPLTDVAKAEPWNRLPFEKAPEDQEAKALAAAREAKQIDFYFGRLKSITTDEPDKLAAVTRAEEQAYADFAERTSANYSRVGLQFQLPPTPRLEASELNALGVPGVSAKVLAGVQNAGAGLGDFFLSPTGVGTMAAAKAPVALQRAIAAYFSVKMVGDLPAITDKLAEAIVNRDWQGITEEGLNALTTPFFIGATASHAVGATGSVFAPKDRAATIEPVAPLTADALRATGNAGTPAPAGPSPLADTIKARANFTDKQTDALLREPVDVQREVLRRIGPNDPAGKFWDELIRARQVMSGSTLTDEAAPAPQAPVIVAPTATQNQPDAPLVADPDAIKPVLDPELAAEQVGGVATPQLDTGTDTPVGGEPKTEAAPEPEAPPATPDWVKANIKALSDPLEANGMADTVEDLAAQGKTAGEIASALGLTTEQVRAVRAARGIPAADQPEEFKKWAADREAKATQPEPPKAPEPAPEPVPDTSTPGRFKLGDVVGFRGGSGNFVGYTVVKLPNGDLGIQSRDFPEAPPQAFGRNASNYMLESEFKADPKNTVWTVESLASDIGDRAQYVGEENMRRAVDLLNKLAQRARDVRGVDIYGAPGRGLPEANAAPHITGSIQRVASQNAMIAKKWKKADVQKANDAQKQLDDAFSNAEAVLREDPAVFAKKENQNKRFHELRKAIEKSGTQEEFNAARQAGDDALANGEIDAGHHYSLGLNAATRIQQGFGPKPTPPAPPADPNEINEGDTIEWTDNEGKKQTGEVEAVMVSHSWIPGRSGGVGPEERSYTIKNGPNVVARNNPQKIDKLKPLSDIAPNEEPTTRIGQPGADSPELDVREPAGPGSPTLSDGQTLRPPGPEAPSGTESGGPNDQGGTKQPRSVGSGNAGTGTSGRASVGGQPADPDTGEGAESDSRKPVAPPAPLGPNDLNHVLPRDEDWIPSGNKTKVRANLAAIKLLQKLEAEKRNPTPEEKAVLAQYTGWGGLKQVFDIGKAAYRDRGRYYSMDQERESKNWEREWGKLYDEVKAALPEDEWDAAAASILNAHYTSRKVINGIWDAVRRLGFKGGKALEPAGGVGNFIGLTPEDLRGRTQWRAVELDKTSAGILAKLYPQAHVLHSGFEDARIPVNSQDLVISNVPFAKDGPRDERYPRLSLHNYFFARGLDLLKPGGIMAAITSDSTLDNSGSGKEARELMAEKADLIGAIRLPNDAFSENAGTEVTTDVLFFRKRDGSPFKGEPFVRTELSKTHKGEPIEINEYFAQHPNMLLGRMSNEGTMYRPGQRALLPTPGADLTRQLEEAVNRLPPNVFGAQVTPEELAKPTVRADVGAKVGQLVLKDGKPFMTMGDGSLEAPEWLLDAKPAKIEQAKRYIAIRDQTKSYINKMQSPDVTDAELAADRATLNRLYDEYVKKHGVLNARGSKYLQDDVDYPLAMALEDDKTSYVEQTRNGKQILRRVVEYSKGSLFRERTIFPRLPPEHVDTVNDGLQVSLNFTGKVDPDYISRLTGQPTDTVKASLRESGRAFENPETGQWEGRAAYLSGFVKGKLKAAREAVEDSPEFATNVSELEKVQPAPIPIDKIGIKLGGSWIPPERVQQFIKDRLGVESGVTFTKETGDWRVNPGRDVNSERNVSTNGIHGWKGTDLVQKALNHQGPIVTVPENYIKEDGSPGVREVKDPQKTLAAQAKQDALQKQFADWAKTTPDAAAELEKIYNERFNGTVWPKFDAPTWTHYPGASEDITLRDHQKQVVTRMLQNSTLLAHAVGTGKTYAMITAAQEMRRLGLAKKPMIVVQNATIEQFARSYKRLYPTARILVPSPAEREAASRNRTMSRIATGDWDAVVIPQSFVNMLPDDPLRQRTYIKDRLKELQGAALESRATSGKKSSKSSDIQKAIKRLEDKLANLADRRTDNVLTFEQTGVDALFVDEAHEYKKLEFATKMDNVKGLDTGASERAFSMFMKARWVQERNQGRNVTFATGTPVSNTIAEAWNMMRFLRPDVLKRYGMPNFDDFEGMFGEKITNMEMTAGGTWKPVVRFAKFINGPELIAAWRTVADVVTSDELKLPGLPSLKNGKATAIKVEQTPDIAKYVEHLRDQLAAFDAMSGKEKRENSFIPLVVFGLAKKASLDMRMINPDLPDHPASKLNRAADEVKRIYDESTPVAGTQMIFADSFQDNPKKPRFNLYEEVKKKLVARGIPANEITILTDDIKGAKREAIFNKFNDGSLRIAIGSTARMGTGINAQAHLIGLHHLDAPARPMDIEQRNGRMIRQLNENPVVEELRYGVENTLDAAMFQKLATKQKFINQILRGDVTGRDFEDAANETSMSYEEQMAAFSGDKRAVEKVALDNQIRQMESLRSGHHTQIREAHGKIKSLETTQIPSAQKSLDQSRERAAAFAKAFPPKGEPALEMSGKTFTGNKAVVPMLDKAFAEMTKALTEKEGVAPNGHTTGNTYEARLNGEPIRFRAGVWAEKDATIDPAKVKVDWWFPGASSPHEVRTGQGLLANSLPAELETLARQPEWNLRDLEAKHRDLRELKGFITQPFEQEAELAKAKERYAALEAELKAEGEKKPAKPAAPDPDAPAQDLGTLNSDDAPVTFDHEEDIPGEGPTKFYKLTDDLGPHAKGDVISEHELREEGHEPPAGLSEGPGAASWGDVPGGSQLNQLTNAIRRSLPADSTLPGKISFIQRLQDKATDIKGSVLGALARAQAVKNAIWESYTSLPEYTDMSKSVGRWTYANQKADFESRQFAQRIKRAIPDAGRREAITNWIQADGDAAILRFRASHSVGSLKRGYELAQHLTDYEKTVGLNIQQYLESQLQRGIEAGILKDGVENYVNQVWKRPNAVTQKLLADFANEKLQPNFKFAKRRIFGSYFEGEQRGFEPTNKDIGALITLYDAAFNKTLAARAFLRDLLHGKASDGRPLVELSGSGRIVGDVPGVPAGVTDSNILVRPYTKGEDSPDYRPIDHPALRGWKWIKQSPERELTRSEIEDRTAKLAKLDPADPLKKAKERKINAYYNAVQRGRGVLMDSQFLVHPEIYAKLLNRLANSKWRQNAVGNAILNTQSVVKQTMLAASGFHQVQETIHALGHRVSPTNLTKINFDDPTQKALVQHGLQIADYNAMQEFGEGLAGGALTNKIPWVGSKVLQPYQEWLFQDYIPRLKMTMATKALARNLEAYRADLTSGKISRDQLLEMTARQGNAAFGELNYRYMGRSPTFQDSLRAFLLAPDFLEARGQFVAQALKPYGREQLMALGLLAATMFVTARVLNKATSDDYHWDKPFAYVVGEKEYTLRTVPGDLLHMFSDSRRFFYNRISPLFGRALVEFLTGRDDRGVKRDLLDQVKDLAKSGVPISLRARDDVRWWEAFMNSFGLQEKRFSAVTEMEEAGRKYRATNHPATPMEFTYDADKDLYRPLHVALLNGDQSAAQKAYDKLKETVPSGKIGAEVGRYYNRPFTGNKATEGDWLKTLDQHGKATLTQARAERQSNLNLYYKLKK